MGFASYFEDIISRMEKLEEIIVEHNRLSPKRINIDDYFEIRKQILLMSQKLKPYLNQEIEIVKNSELQTTIQHLQNENHLLKEEQKRLASVVKIEKEFRKSQQVQENSLKEELEQLKEQTVIHQLEESNLLLNLKNCNQNLNVCMRDLNFYKQIQDKAEDKYSELLLNVIGLFQQMQNVIKSNDWYHNKDSHKQIALIVKKGLNIS